MQTTATCPRCLAARASTLPRHARVLCAEAQHGPLGSCAPLRRVALAAAADDGGAGTCCEGLHRQCQKPILCCTCALHSI